MALTVPGLRTVTVIRRIRRKAGNAWARDERGNAVYDELREDIAGCSVQPNTGQEDNSDGRVEVTATSVVYAPPEWPGGVIDAVEIDGIRYEIEGRPQRWHHPRLAHVVVTIREVQGG